MQKHIVFVGAGGAGMSSLLLFLHSLDIARITAIDKYESEITKKLAAHDIPVIIGHGVYTIQEDDIVIYSDAAIQSPEVQQAKQYTYNNHKKVMPPMSYFQFLGEISKYMETIAIAGTHGKSTTTALTATALAAHHGNFGLALMGAPVTQRNNQNYLINTTHQEALRTIIQHILSPKNYDMREIMKRYLFVVEADEYNHHFLYLDSDWAIITNIELDHADVYGNFKNYMETFSKFSSMVKQGIFVLEQTPGIPQYIELPLFQERPILLHRTQKILFDFTYLLGSHNHDNASLALACTEKLLTSIDTSIHSSDIQNTIQNFQGLWRRGELLTTNSHHIPIISDYAHHPTEIASTLVALQEKYPGQQITCIFQPHQVRRVLEFWDSFIDALHSCDTLILYDIYTARENLTELQQQLKDTISGDVASITSLEELGNIFAKACGGIYTNDIDNIREHIESTTTGIIIIFTAGNLDRQIRQLYC